MRDHLQQVERQTGKQMAALQGPALPSSVAYLWQWFLELHSARGQSMMGAAAITYTDLHHWAALTGRSPRIWEIQTLKELDVRWLTAQQNNQANAK